jgi:hypothetical protein
MRVAIRGFVTCVVFTCVGLPALLSEPAQAAVPAQVTAANWTVTPSTPTSTTLSNFSDAVSCVTSTFCMATGTAGLTTSDDVPLAQQWNGTSWTNEFPQNPTGSTESQLEGVSCVATSWCMAVGYTGVADITALAEAWNGATWSMVPTPAIVTSTNTQLAAISCTSTTDCIAVGLQKPSSGYITLAEQWNGSSWTLIAPTGTGAPKDSVLDGVSCSGPSWCMAVGDQQPGSVQITLAEEWNGTSWTAVPSPNPSSPPQAFLNGVSCAGRAFCAATGITYGASLSDTTLIETWNGSSWTIADTPDTTGGFSNELAGISCFSATACAAVGSADADAKGTHYATEALTWDGQTWSLASTPNISSSAPEDQFNAVACLTDWACVAMGDSSNGTAAIPYNVAAPIARSGYRIAASDGGVFTFGTGAPYLGSLGHIVLNKPIVGMAVTPAGDGYYLVASDGGVFSFGSAHFYGSTGAITLNKPIVGMAVTSDGAGYWLVASDGGIFAFGDARFYGSTGAITLNKPIVGMTATPNGLGYYLVASDGGIFAFGNARFEGSTGNIALNKPIVGMAETTSGGYYLVASDGGIFTFPPKGGPPFDGSTGNIHLNEPIIGMTTVDNGYYLVASDGGIFTFPAKGGPPFDGSTGNIHLNEPIVGIAS